MVSFDGSVRLYSFAEISSFMASSKPELSIMPPTKSLLSIFVNMVILLAQESRANLPIPLRPIKGRPDDVD